MHVAIGSDHAGFELKEAVKQRLLWASTGVKNPSYRDVVAGGLATLHRALTAAVACIRRGGSR
jgi:ribose 5-phosphate isomerase RpiB